MAPSRTKGPRPRDTTTRRAGAGRATAASRAGASSALLVAPRLERRSDRAHTTVEEYCTTIWCMREDGVEVTRTALAARRGITRMAAGEMVTKMVRLGYARTEGFGVHLTAEGERIGERLIRRRRIAERLLVDLFGLPVSEAVRQGRRWAPALSELTEARLVQILGGPTTCPCGNPIPGTGQPAAPGVPLATIAVGTPFTVTRIPEELEDAEGCIELLEQHQILPGSTGVLLAVADDGATRVGTNRGPLDLTAFVSARIRAVARGADGAHRP